MKSFPNILTVFRLVAPIPIFFALFYVARPYGTWIAFALFAFAALTDFLDGYLARRYDWQSEIGRVLDPISDKTLVLSVGFLLIVSNAAALGHMDILLVIPFALILLRELFVSGLREGLAGKLNVHVSWMGKTKTTFQLIAVGLLFFLPILGHRLGSLTQGMDNATLQGILDGVISDEIGLLWAFQTLTFVEYAVYIMLWTAAALSVVSGFQYFNAAKQQGFGT